MCESLQQILQCWKADRKVANTGPNYRFLTWLKHACCHVHHSRIMAHIYFTLSNWRLRSFV